MFSIEIVASAVNELRNIPVHYRRMVERDIDEILTYSPLSITRNVKCLRGLIPTFEHVEPIWELRVGNWRVFYDADELSKKVVIRAIRRKTQGKTTKEIT